MDFNQFMDLMKMANSLTRPRKEKVVKYNDENTLEHYLSGGLQNLGIDIAYEYMQYIIDNYGSNLIISVGSGCGVFEKLLEQYHNINIICIDPNPNEYINPPKQFKRQPDYSYVDNIIKIVPFNLIDCTMILNWSSPNSSTYDYDAMTRLQPKIILWIGDTTGVAGGAKFIKFLEETQNNETNYNVVKKHTIQEKDRYDWDIFYTIMILVRI